VSGQAGTRDSFYRGDTGARARVDGDARTRLGTGGRARLDSDARTRVDGDARARLDADGRNRLGTDGRARLDADSRTRLDADGRTRLDADGRADVDADTGARARVDADSRLSDGRIVSPTRVRVGSGYRDGIRYWDGSSWIWGFGPRYGYWDGFGWGYGPWSRYGSFWGGWRPGYGYWDDYYGYGPYAYGAPYYSQPGYAAAPAPRTGLGVYMDERDNAVFVRSVVPDSPAEQAGLRPGDMIIAIDGNLITSADQVRQIVAEHDPGDELEIETDRNGREVRTAAVLEEHRQVF
jgi:hypothetical protein